jgi:signal transduction histidine kinase/DNA-binding response OmpR family regulator/HAMP domain-containing protein
VKGVGGVWKDLTDSVNQMASNLTGQVRNIAQVTTAVAKGDLSRKITMDVRGEILELKDTINTMVDQLNAFAGEVTRVAREVGTDGKLGGQAQVRGIAGVWKDLTDSVNSMASNLTSQVRNIAQVTTAVANGDLSRKITVDVQGEILELKDTINTMVDQLNSFASEVTRVAREVGTEGMLGGQADVKGVGGVWKDLTDSVNQMAGNLTTQVRGIAKVVTAVANGDLKRKLVLETKGEIAELAETINSMIDTLAVFADQVTNVARDVGIEGKLGGQARVPGTAGIWKDLTDSVNQMAATLTTQVRAIAEVATAVTKGDLTQQISVEAVGEVADLKDNINQMIGNLRETTALNNEQDWLKTNVARFTRMLQGQRDLLTVSRMVLSELAPLVNAQHGTFYVQEAGSREPMLRLVASYAFQQRKNLGQTFHYGEGLIGQCALEKQSILLTNVPADYIRISSSLGEAPPMNNFVLPVLFEGEVKAVIELASFNRFSAVHQQFLDQLVESMGIVLNTIEATMRTEQLLTQSQALTEELQSQQKELTAGNQRLEDQANTLRRSEELLRQQQDELQSTNLELQQKARQLAEQNSEVERKNREVEQAKQALEDKAEQLALISKYKSEFLANMSHELRTPLNSLLILAKVLADNADGKLSPKQIKFAETIYAAGNDLLVLINDILDLSKIESGMMAVDIEDVLLGDVRDYVIGTFRHVAEGKELQLTVEEDNDAPKVMSTDNKRLQQVLKNLLSNALKFTEKGSVTLRMRRAESGWSEQHDILNSARTVIAFDVQDTGIGIPDDKRTQIFEAFRQADGTTSRKYGGTGLGLSISRELARLLGGEIQLQSEPGSGSTFTLFLPQAYAPLPEAVRISRPRLLDTRPIRQDLEKFVKAVAESDTPVQPAALAPGTMVETLSPGFYEPDTAPVLSPAEVQDDRGQITSGDKVLLIIEDDPKYIPMLVELAHERGFKCLAAPRGEKGLKLARDIRPSAITLDIRLPDMAGWVVLSRLKYDPATRHIPVHVISIDEDYRRGLSLGAESYTEKVPDRSVLERTFDRIERSVSETSHKLLLVSGDEEERQHLPALVGDQGGVLTPVVETGAEAVELAGANEFDCVVLTSYLTDMTAAELIVKLQKQAGRPELPIIVYAKEGINSPAAAELRELAEYAICKTVETPERLLEETAVFLNRREEDLTDEQRRIIEEARTKDAMLSGGKVLIIDDDVRNIFALTSGLERHKLTVLNAESGKAGIDAIRDNPDVDLVLMDIMMPEMDGYETTRRIRQIPEFRNLPVIALTAKAMKGDREKCIEAGASDYIPKPIVLDELVALLRVWLPPVHSDQHAQSTVGD